MEMKAMLFAAGMGKRLGERTRHQPKALVAVAGKTMLEINLARLKTMGFTSVIINVHHFAEQIIEFLNDHNNFGMDIQISHEIENLLDTGGGLQKASWFLTNTPAFLAHNVDIFSQLDLDVLMQTHLQSKALATLAVSRRESSRYLLFDENGRLCGWQNTITGEKILSHQGKGLQQLAFSGIHALSPNIFNEMSEQGSFSIIDVYLRLASEYPILAYEHDEMGWFDVGTPKKLSRAEAYLIKNQ